MYLFVLLKYRYILSTDLIYIYGGKFPKSKYDDRSFQEVKDVPNSVQYCTVMQVSDIDQCGIGAYVEIYPKLMSKFGKPR